MHAPTKPTPEQRAAARELAAEVRRRHRGLLRELWIEVDAGGFVLHGHASSFYGKQVAFHEVLRLGAGPVVANRIAVG